MFSPTCLLVLGIVFLHFGPYPSLLVFFFVFFCFSSFSLSAPIFLIFTFHELFNFFYQAVSLCWDLFRIWSLVEVSGIFLGTNFSVGFLGLKVFGWSSLILWPIWSPIELFLRWVPRVVPVLREPGAVGHAHRALPSWLRPGRENTISMFFSVLLLEPICTFSDAKRANGSTAKGASRKGAIPAHLPRLRASLLV